MIYFINAGEQEYVEEYIDDWPRYEVALQCGFVVSSTRSKARWDFIKWSKTMAGGKVFLEFTDKISVVKITEDNFNLPNGVINESKLDENTIKKLYSILESK